MVVFGAQILDMPSSQDSILHAERDVNVPAPNERGINHRHSCFSDEVVLAVSAVCELHVQHPKPLPHVLLQEGLLRVAAIPAFDAEDHHVQVALVIVEPDGHAAENRHFSVVAPEAASFAQNHFISTPSQFASPCSTSECFDVLDDHFINFLFYRISVTRRLPLLQSKLGDGKLYVSVLLGRLGSLIAISLILIHRPVELRSPRGRQRGHMTMLF
mmetsp:Transcript_3249/g.6061  ORF Transcript_3249/g.6061 Transcript_3249/m.6061 type:complete len:215 (+) Transcript_3249:837-1481(+)|eukprot:CAMPEP_0197519012 /NCGR_PEP_ID=MMETSP1318-20131121/4273_1 /TAXON_ID=552666 /ORGANISM="Partenskyella glossopodia, Strain RCC365" /LENGTH=214 /DNA_ID=CAMNT_0043069755 /DNA_START=852 /DNA_END=1496 /DNA_ORIENTATION=-